MSAIEGILGLFANRAFSSVWFWLLLAGSWTMISRNVLGVPPDIIARARRGAEAGVERDEAAIILLDWLSLHLPRWQMGDREGAVLLGIAMFGLAALATLGFGYGYESAQALVFLLAPLGLVALLRCRLAAQLSALLTATRQGEMAPSEAAFLAAGKMRLQRYLVSGLSILTMLVAAWWGALWLLAHPYGF